VDYKRIFTLFELGFIYAKGEGVLQATLASENVGGLASRLGDRFAQASAVRLARHRCQPRYAFVSD